MKKFSIIPPALILFLIVLIHSCGEKSSATPDTRDILMITPYVSSTDISAIHEAFSSDDTAPWGFEHNGIDFSPSGNLVPFQAVSSGTITGIKLWQNDRSGNYQVNVTLQYNDRFSVEYGFEPFSNAESDGQIQLDNIYVTSGEKIAQGELIGKLYTVGNGAHVHFGLKENGNWVCPEIYFTSEARTSIMNIIHKNHPDWNMCY